MSTSTDAAGWTPRYYVPWSQVHPGSRAGQAGNVHLTVELIEPHRPPVSLTSVTGRRTTITRKGGTALCGRTRGWYEREPSAREGEHERCPRCIAMSARYGVEWPERTRHDQ